MWQRSQTLYLGLATLLFFILFFSPLATAIGTDGQSETINYVDKIPYLCLMISVFCAHLFALVLFKVRGVQVRVATIAALLAAGFQIWLAVDFFTAPDGIVFKVTAVFPLVCVILDILAIRGIMADIMIVGTVAQLKSSRRAARRKKH